MILVSKKAIPTPKGYRKGRAMPLSACCRDIRIACQNKLGEIYEGYYFNPDGTKRFQRVMVIKEKKGKFMGSSKRPAEIIVVELIKPRKFKDGRNSKRNNK